MILGAPAADPDVIANRDQLLKRHTEIRAELAHVELRLAADIIRHLFGTAAVWLLADHDSDGTDITPLVVLDGDGKPLWFNSSGGRHDGNDYPGAQDIADDHGRPLREMDQAAQTALIGHLAAAYDADGVSGAWFAGADDFYGSDFNILTLSVPAAFEPYQPDDPDEEPKF